MHSLPALILEALQDDDSWCFEVTAPGFAFNPTTNCVVIVFSSIMSGCPVPDCHLGSVAALLVGDSAEDVQCCTGDALPLLASPIIAQENMYAHVFCVGLYFYVCPFCACVFLCWSVYLCVLFLPVCTCCIFFVRPTCCRRMTLPCLVCNLPWNGWRVGVETPRNLRTWFVCSPQWVGLIPLLHVVEIALLTTYNITCMLGLSSQVKDEVGRVAVSSWSSLLTVLEGGLTPTPQSIDELGDPTFARFWHQSFQGSSPRHLTLVWFVNLFLQSNFCIVLLRFFVFVLVF